MTGVSPVTLDDLTSGFNIGWHISTKPAFNQMLGFSTEDVREMFEYFKSAGKVRADCDVESVIAEMKPWYDNYCFQRMLCKPKARYSIATWFFIIFGTMLRLAKLLKR